jgi:hypothetical protein
MNSFSNLPLVVMSLFRQGEHNLTNIYHRNESTSKKKRKPTMTSAYSIFPEYYREPPVKDGGDLG